MSRPMLATRTNGFVKICLLCGGYVRYVENTADDPDPAWYLQCRKCRRTLDPDHEVVFIDTEQPPRR